MGSSRRGGEGGGGVGVVVEPRRRGRGRGGGGGGGVHQVAHREIPRVHRRWRRMRCGRRRGGCCGGGAEREEALPPLRRRLLLLAALHLNPRRAAPRLACYCSPCPSSSSAAPPLLRESDGELVGSRRGTSGGRAKELRRIVDYGLDTVGRVPQLGPQLKHS